MVFNLQTIKDKLKDKLCRGAPSANPQPGTPHTACAGTETLCLVEGKPVQQGAVLYSKFLGHLIEVKEARLVDRDGQQDWVIPVAPPACAPARLQPCVVYASACSWTIPKTRRFGWIVLPEEGGAASHLTPNMSKGDAKAFVAFFGGTAVQVAWDAPESPIKETASC